MNTTIKIDDKAPCETGCNRGFVPCEHTNLEFDASDGMWWCQDCDTPADEVNPTRQCMTCF